MTKYVKIEIVREYNKKPEKYSFSGENGLEQLAKLLHSKFNVSIENDEKVVKNND